jgi:glycosyltransferase involved in cell wall biosynthesis
LGVELGKHDVYVSASRFDPGPNHVLESLACGLPTFVHADGGGCVEFAGSAQAYDDWNELRDFLTTIKPGYVMKNVDHVRLYDWRACVQEYNAFLEATWQNRDSQIS